MFVRGGGAVEQPAAAAAALSDEEVREVSGELGALWTCDVCILKDISDCRYLHIMGRL